MMYWLNDSGRVPSGHLPGEDCIDFDRSNLAVVEIGGRWKVVEGTLAPRLRTWSRERHRRASLHPQVPLRPDLLRRPA